MLNNTKTLTKLAGLVLIMIALMVGLSWYGITGMASIDAGLRTVYQDRVIPMEQLRSATDDYYQVRIEVVNLLSANDKGVVQQGKAKIGSLVADARKNWDAYIATYLTDEEKQIVSRTASDLAKYDTVREQVLGLLQQLNREQGKTIIMVTHDPKAAEFASRIVHLDKGALAAEPEGAAA